MLDEIRKAPLIRDVPGSPKVGAGDGRYCGQSAGCACARGGHGFPNLTVPMRGQRKTIVADNPGIVVGDFCYTAEFYPGLWERHLGKLLPIKMHNQRDTGAAFGIACDPEV